jgi:hypothetical protein
VVVASRNKKNPENLAGGAALERVSLVDGSRKRLATLPRFVCKLKPDAVDAPDSSTMAIQSADDFIIDVDKRHACMTLMDRNVDMVSVWLDIRIDLVNGRIERWLTMGGESCVPSAGVKVMKGDESSGPRCENASRLPARDSTPSRFEFTESGILKERGQGGARILRVPGYGVNSGFDESPSGRWSVLRGDVEEGDYIHARLLLLDRDKGELFRIAESRSWPPPLRPKGKHGLPQIKTPVDTIDVVGESDVRWLGSSAESELLVVDSLVVKPGHYAFSVDGEIAR